MNDNDLFIKRRFSLLIIFSLLIANILILFLPLQTFEAIAHRGASKEAPENTMAAFERAAELQYDFIELDIQLSKDGELVVIHDATVNRTTNGTGSIKDMTLADIQALDAGSWFSSSFKGEKIPLLQEVLDRFGGEIGLLIEIKYPDLYPEISETLSTVLTAYVEKGLPRKLLKVQSFNIHEVEKFHQLSPNISTGLLLNHPLDLFQLTSYRHFASFLSINYYSLTNNFIKQAEFYGYDIYSWTIKDQFQFYSMQKIGVHGIISDEPMKHENSHLYAFIRPFIKGQELLRTFFV